MPGKKKYRTALRCLLLLSVLPPFCSTMCLPEPPVPGEDNSNASPILSQDQSFGVTLEVADGCDPIGETSEVGVVDGQGDPIGETSEVKVAEGLGDPIGESSEVGVVKGQGDPINIGDTSEMGVAGCRDTIGDTIEREKRQTEEERELSVGEIIMKSYEGELVVMCYSIVFLPLVAIQIPLSH